MLPDRIKFPNGRCATVVRTDDLLLLPQALAALAIAPARPVLVLIGGAAGFEAHREEQVRRILRIASEVVQSLGAVLIDGGTQSGIIALMGQTYAAGGFDFPLLGVAVESLVRGPGAEALAQRTALDPQHTHFLLVPGSKWGEESAWLSECARILAQASPSLTLLINGGEISRQDVTRGLHAGRPVVVMAGTGRLADEYAAALPSPLAQAVSVDDLETLSLKLHSLLTRS